MRPVLTLILFVALSVPALPGQSTWDPRAAYTKAEYQVPMRDGVKLHTIVYRPRETTLPSPIMLSRTPYSAGPYGEEFRASIGPSRAMAREGYYFVYQDVRGRWMSEGEFVNARPHRPGKKGLEIDESTDTYDTIEWLLQNLPNHNGRVGMWGISYPGFYASMGLIESHPALKASSPQAPIGDWFIGDDWHHHGAFFLIDSFNFFARIGVPRPKPTSVPPPDFDHGTPDGYQFFLDLGPLANANRRHFKGEIAFWNDLMAHGTYDDFWKARRVMPHLKGLKTPTLVVAGWYDAEDLYGTLETYQAIEKQNPGLSNRLVMGPWCHGCWARPNFTSLGNIDFGSNTSQWYQEQVELPFFNFYLKDKGTLGVAEATMFLTGANQWMTYEQWPPAGSRDRFLYLDSRGKLAFDAPQGAEQNDSFVSDPAKPVPYHPQISNRRGYVTYKTEDQRFAAARPDVLVYQTEPLEEDVTLAGPIEAELLVSTTGTDADWVVKLIDVFPPNTPNPEPNPREVQLGGYQMLVRGEVMRGKFRQSYETPRPFVPNAPTTVSIPLQDVHHRFQKGHRVMVQVQSSWFPLVDRNPQTFVDIYQAKEEDFQSATHRVYRGGRRGSRLKLRVLP